MDRPKRKYTVSDRVLAASRRNLALANAVDKAIRYRMTPRRRIACHRNLVCAQTARRTSSRYGPIRRGAYCISLERSLELAGESPAEFRAHLEDWRGAFETPPPWRSGAIHRPDKSGQRGEGEEQKKLAPITSGLARALGQASWRRLRVLRGQARWEARRLGRCLAEAIHRAETVTPQERAESPEIGAEHALELMADVLEVFSDTIAIDPALDRLNRRLERLLELWLESCTGEHVSLKHFTQRAGRGLAPMDQGRGAGAWPQALGNALVGPGRVLKSLLPAPAVRVLAPTFWRERSWEAVERYRAELRAANPGLDPDFAYEIALKEFAPRERDTSRPETAMGYTASLDNLTRAFEAALLGPSALAERGDSSGLGRPGTEETSPELKALIREVAEMAWQRLEYFRAAARAESEKVKRILREAPRSAPRSARAERAERQGNLAEPASPGPMASAPSPGSAASPGHALPEREGSGGPRDLAEQLLQAFEPDATRWRETFRLEQKLEASFRRLLEKMSVVGGQLRVAS